MENEEIEYWLELWSIFLFGVFAKITGRLWDIKFDHSFPNFVFSCQLGDFRYATGPHEFGSKGNIFGELALQAMNISKSAEKEGYIRKLDYSLIDGRFMKNYFAQVAKT